MKNNINVALYLKEGTLNASWSSGNQTIVIKYPFETGKIDQITNHIIDRLIAQNYETNVKYVICPGGIGKPLIQGVYFIDDNVVKEVQEQKWGVHVNNEVTLICSKLAKLLSATAIMCDPMSSDGLYVLNRITSHSDVKKYSRYHACEHQAAIYFMAKKLGKRPEELNIIVANIDDEVSVGAHQFGVCIDVNDVIGLEGPMGFKSSGDVPVAQLAMYTEKQDIDILRNDLRYKSGVKGYLGIDKPEKIDELVASGNSDAKLIADAVAYQTAKWIGSSAMCLKGNVDTIILIGKGIRSKSIINSLIPRIQKIATVECFEPNVIEYLLNVTTAVELSSCKILSVGRINNGL